eukprot:m.47779 g.47779  ORF g.47779 m.47779 type:complete len:74 (+) comp20568_c0_seq2:190-411(+)
MASLKAETHAQSSKPSMFNVCTQHSTVLFFFLKERLFFFFLCFECLWLLQSIDGVCVLRCLFCSKTIRMFESP